MALGLSSVRAGRGGILHREQEQGRDEPGEGVGHQRPAGPDRDHQEGADGRAEDVQAAPQQGVQRVGLLELLARDQRRHDARHRREGDGRRHALDRREHDQHPDLGRPGDHQQRDRALQGARDDVGDLEHDGPREPVGDHAAAQQEDHHRDGVRRQHLAQRGGGVGDLEDGEGQRDVGHHAAEGVDEPGREEPAEVAFPERGDRVRPLHAGHPTTAARPWSNRVR